MKQKTFRGPDGRANFSCISKPFIGTVAYIPSQRYRSGVAAIVVPENGYAAFLRRRHPTSWYAAAAIDMARGQLNTPAVRAFDQATRKVVTVMFEAQGFDYGDFDRPYRPVDLDRHEIDLVDAAISNCRLR